MDGEQAPPEAASDGIPLIEGWMLGQFLFPFAMEEIVRVPPANDAI
jgi:hypothetical protein